MTKFKRVKLKTGAKSNRYHFPAPIQAVYDREQKRIRDTGVEPDICPDCEQATLWPAPNQVRNALARWGNKRYICSPCGRSEAGKLTEDAVELAEMEKLVDKSDK